MLGEKYRKLLSTVLEQTKLSGLTNILQTIASFFEADGCILWEITPSFSDNIPPKNQYLVILDQWLYSEDNLVHEIPLLESLTGESVLKEKSLKSDNIEKDDRIYKENRYFFEKHKFKVMCCVPMIFNDNNKGSLNLYRKDIKKPFTENELSQIIDLSELVAPLFQTIRNKVSLNTIQDTNTLLENASIKSNKGPVSSDYVKKIFKKICEKVADTLQCQEVSIIMEDKVINPGKYIVMATTMPEIFEKSEYTKQTKTTLTTWVINNGSPLRIDDLRRYQRDEETLKEIYKGLNWSYKKINMTLATDRIKPIGFIASPIKKGKSVVGVIRCSRAKKSPYYFGNTEINLLNLVATHIVRYWSGWIDVCETELDNKVLKKSVKEFGEFNKNLNMELEIKTPRIENVFNFAITHSYELFKEVELINIRLANKDNNDYYLYTAAYNNSFFKNKSQKQKESLNKKFYISEGSPTSLGNYVFNTKEIRIINDVIKHKYYSEDYPDTKSMIVVPIIVGQKVYGVIDFRGTIKGKFSSYTINMAKLFGQQLGLSYYIIETVSQLINKENEVKNSAKAQVQTLQDLRHQLRGPLLTAYTRVQGTMKGLPRDNNLRRELEKIRGLCGKSKRVTMSIGLFAALASNKKPTIKMTKVNKDLLVRMLIEAAMDNEILVDPNREIKFQVLTDTFNVLDNYFLESDLGLIEQAANNLLDNAAKYSFSNTKVIISAGTTKKTGRFYLSVISTGLPMTKIDIKFCTDRTWRGEDARVNVGEGTGIGLWIVKHIMEAHKGELLVNPTDNNGSTEFRLYFPSDRLIRF